MASAVSFQKVKPEKWIQPLRLESLIGTVRLGRDKIMGFETFNLTEHH